MKIFISSSTLIIFSFNPFMLKVTYYDNGKHSSGNFGELFISEKGYSSYIDNVKGQQRFHQLKIIVTKRIGSPALDNSMNDNSSTHDA